MYNYWLDTTGDGHLHRIDDFGEDIMWKIDDWLHSFDGWGLAFLLVDTDNEEDREGLQSFILHMYEHILEDSENNVVDPEDAYKSLFAHWFPVLEEEMEFIYVNECMFLKGPKEGNNWTQTLRIIFSTFADERIIVDIFIEKLKSSKLLDLAAGVVAANIDEERAEDVESLIIPKTLKLLVRKKILDLKWARFQVKDGHELEYEDILQSTMPEFLFLWWFISLYYLFIV